MSELSQNPTSKEEAHYAQRIVLDEPDMASSKKMLLLGTGLDHSLSPVIYRAIFAAAGLDWTYEVRDVATEDEAQAIIAGDDWDAINVTTPFKALALKLATRAETAAQAAGGANLLVRTADGKDAFNTDGIGCVSFLARSGCPVSEHEIAVCGTGPTARVIAYAAACGGVKKVALFSREKDRAIDAAQHTCGGIFAQTYEDGAEFLRTATLIINATTLGMKPGDPSPVAPELLQRSGEASLSVLDCVYGHGETAFMAAARAAGCKNAFDGVGMLTAQATMAFQTIFMANKMRAPIAFFEAQKAALSAVEG